MRQNPPRDENTRLRQIKDILRRLQVLETAPAPRMPFAELTHSTTQSIPNTTVTSVVFNSEVFDTHNGHDTLANTSRYVAPIAGVYLVAVQAPFVSNVNGKRELWLSRSDGVGFQTATVWPATALDAFLSVSAPIPLAAGAHIEPLVWQNSGGALNISNAIHSGQRMLVQWIGKYPG